MAREPSKQWGTVSFGEAERHRWGGTHTQNGISMDPFVGDPNRARSPGVRKSW